MAPPSPITRPITQPIDLSQKRICARCMQSFLAPPGEVQETCGNCRPRTRHRGEQPETRVVFVHAGWRGFVHEAQTWCKGRSALIRLPLWLYLAYTLVRHALEPGEYRSLFDGLNLGLHELGHMVFRPLGEFMTFAGGTIAQCLAPVIAVFMFRRQRDYFGISVAVCWLATNLWGAALYAADARALKLTLVAPGRGVIPPGEGASGHDWRYMLGKLGIREWDTAIGAGLGIAATVVMLSGLAFGGWLLWRMWRTPRA